MKKIFKILLKALLAFIIAAILYFAAAYILGKIPQDSIEASDGEVTLYLNSNGVHADIVMPLSDDVFDWTSIINPADSPAGQGDAPIRYVGIGWGERNFYLNTPQWSDLTASTAVQALSGINSTLIHAIYYRDPPREGENTVKFTVSREQYLRLSANLMRHFKLKAGKAIPVVGAHYSPDDAFYEAEGRYHLFNTCNSWLNRRLTESGINGVVWTPFPDPLLDSHRTNTAENP